MAKTEVRRIKTDNKNTVQMKGVHMNYKKEIIRILEKIEDEKFLRQLYTIVVKHIKRTRG